MIAVLASLIVAAILVYPCHSGGDPFVITDARGHDFVAFVLAGKPEPRGPYVVERLARVPRRFEVVTRVVVSLNGVRFVRDYAVQADSAL